jgi:hypothetical protein
VIRSRAAGVVVVVLVAGASGTAAASGRPPASRATAESVTASAAALTPSVAFTLPAMSATTVTPATTHHATARHHHHAHVHHVTRPAPLPPCPGLTPSPYFGTPQAAMRYLAQAWNHHDLDALCHVTDPDARRLLDEMHHEAVHLRLAKCDYVTVGLYGCTFRHDYPRHLHQHGVGHAFIEVRSARTPGWYSTGAIGCG